MKTNKLKSFCLLLTFFIFMSFAVMPAVAQISQREPELGIAGFRLGEDEEKTKVMLQGYSPRYDSESGQPKYFFYNGYGNQVLSLTGYSKEHPYLIVGIEVFSVGESYQKKHYQMKDKNSFMSESGFFIGQRPSVSSLMFAIPNITKPKGVIKKKGAPDADEKQKKARVLYYRLNTVDQLNNQEAKINGINFGSYTAEYRFVKNKLNRFSITLNTNAPAVSSL